MSAPDTHQPILPPPYPNMHLNEKDRFKFDYTIWARTGSYTSSVPNLRGLEASVTEINTLVGIDTRNNNTVQKQLDLKANDADLGTISSQNANNVVISGGSITGTTIRDSDFRLQVGTSGIEARTGGVIFTDFNDVGNSGALETDLQSYTLFTNTLSQDNEFIDISGWGTFAANANNKQIKLKIGSTTIFDTGLVAANSGSWMIDGKVVRTAASAGQAIIRIVSDNALIANEVTFTTLAENYLTNLLIVFTGTGSSSDDITQYGSTIKWFNKQVV